MSAEELKFDYAPSSRAGCRGCKIKIEKNQLRIGQETTYQEHVTIQWRHLECFSLGRKYKDIDPKEIEGYYNLKKEDKERVIDYFEGGGKKKHAVDQIIDTINDSQKKQKKNKDYGDEEDSEDDEKQKKKQSTNKKKKSPKNKQQVDHQSLGYSPQELTKFKEYLQAFEKKNIEYLKGLLQVNNQTKTGTKPELILKCADGKTLGQIPQCPSCKEGRLRFDFQNGTYKCPGYMDEEVYQVCGKKFNLDEIQREPWIDDLI